MKKFLMISALLPLLFACAPKDRSAEHIALIEKYVKAVENLDYQTMESLLDNNYYGFGPSYGDSINKTEAVNNWKYNIENLYQSIHYNKSRNAVVEVPDGENKGYWVSNWGELNIVYKNGQEITLWANSIYQIVNDKIIKSYTFYNEADALNQLGYVFINPNDL